MLLLAAVAGVTAVAQSWQRVHVCFVETASDGLDRMVVFDS